MTHRTTTESTPSRDGRCLEEIAPGETVEAEQDAPDMADVMSGRAPLPHEPDPPDSKMDAGAATPNPGFVHVYAGLCAKNLPAAGGVLLCWNQTLIFVPGAELFAREDGFWDLR